MHRFAIGLIKFLVNSAIYVAVGFLAFVMVAAIIFALVNWFDIIMLVVLYGLMGMIIVKIVKSSDQFT